MLAVCPGYFSLNCYFLIILFLFISDQIAAEKQLKFAVLIYRHGDRSPFETYINNPYKESSWPDGFGQLTKVGIQQHYELGQYLRRRYAGFVNESYNRHEVFIMSSDVDRTIMSAQANLAGMFPPEGEQLWNSSILWQPIPVHTVPQSIDNLINLPAKNCPLYNKLQNSTFCSPEFQSLIEPYETFLQTLSKDTGFTVEELKTRHTWTTYDALYCESIHNFTLPAWATYETMANLKEVSDILLSSLFGIYKQFEKSRLQGGVLLKTIIRNITNVMSDSTSKQKLIMYSGHDATITALQMALNVFNGKIPPYAACHIFELYIDEKGEYSIEMYYRNESSGLPHLLILPGCNDSCPIQKFIDLTSSVITDDWNKECGIKQSSNSSKLTVAVVILMIACIILLFFLWYCTRRRRIVNYETMQDA